MKAVIVDTTIAGNLIGGAQTFLPKLIQGLNERGVETYLFTNDYPNFKVAAQIEKSNPILQTNLWSEKLLVEDALPILAQWVNDLAPDVYVVSVSPDLGWGVLPLLKSSIATLSIGHTDDETFYRPLMHYSYFINRAIGVSTEVCEKFMSHCELLSENVEWIPYGVEIRDDPPETSYTSKCIKLVYVGRLEEKQKRVSDIIEIIKSLEKEQVDYRFKIIGDGTSLPLFKQHLEQEIAGCRVEMLGWCEKDEVLKHLRISDAFVLTSEYEGFCIALLEAMGNGCCPLVTDIESGNRQLIENGKNGFILSIGDINSFVKKIKLLSENRKELAQLRLAAWETGQNYSISRMVDSYLECFSKAIVSTQIKGRRPIPNFPLMPSCRSKYPLWLRRIKAKINNYISVN